ncbi:MAG: hypothetical protein WAZ18_02365 [Alphaproteobacteria bacterium]
MLDSLGFEEVLVVVGLGLLMFSPAEVARMLNRVLVWKTTAQSWVMGMWKGAQE